MDNKLLKFVVEYLFAPILNGFLFGISIFILASIIMAPLALYLGAEDGLWNYQRSIFVITGLPALTYLIFNVHKIAQGVLVKSWKSYFSIQLKKSS